jgi:Ca2+-binding EF-hand superfamily protein
MEDEACMHSYFEQMTNDQFTELADSLSDAEHSPGTIINNKLQDIMKRYKSMSITEFISQLNAVAPERVFAIIDNLSFLLTTASQTMDEPVIILGRHRYQQLKDAALVTFNVYDLDRDGFITLDEFRNVFELRRKCRGEELPAANNSTSISKLSQDFALIQMKNFDTNQDGQVCFDEFFSFFCLEEFEGDSSDVIEVYRFFGSLSQAQIDETLQYLSEYAEHLS